MKFVHLYEFFFFIIANHLMFVKNFITNFLSDATMIFSLIKF